MAEESLNQRIARGAKATLSAKLIDAAANALLILVLTRYLLTPEGYGLLHYAISIIGTAAMFGSLGIPSSAARYVTEYIEKDSRQVRHVVRFSIGTVVVVSLVVGGLVAAFSDPISVYLDEPALAPLLVLGFGYIALEAGFQIFNRFFQAVNHVEWSAIMRAIFGVIRFVAAVALAAVGYGAVGALAGWLIGYFVAGAVGAAIFYRRFYATFDAAGSVEEDLRRRILEYSVPLTATRGANVLDKRIDTILVGIFLGPVPVSFYTIAKQVSKFTSMPAASLGYTISPTIGEQRAAEQLDSARRVYEKSLSHVLMLYVPAMFGLFLVAEPMIRTIFGEEYLGATPVLQVMAAYVVFTAIDNVTSDGLDFLGRARERAIVKTIAAVGNFLLNLLLIPTIGVVGAAIASVITYSVYTLGNLYFMHQELELNLDRFTALVPTVCAVSTVMALGVWLLLPYVSGIVSLLGVVVFGVAVWGVLVAGTGLVDVDEFRSVL